MRLFVAVMPSAALQKELTAYTQALTDSVPALRHGTRWMKDEGFHITLRFLGESRPDRCLALGDALSDQVKKTRAFSLSINALGAFPKRGRAGILWVGFDRNRTALEKLAEGVEAVCQELGYSREPRPYHPHLTLARIKDPLPRQVLGPAFALPFPRFKEWPVDRIALVQSKLNAVGSVYKIKRWLALNRE